MIAINEILNELGRDCVSNCAFRWLEDATNAYTMMNYYFGNLKPHNELFFFQSGYFYRGFHFLAILISF